jgi:hypothetical protein
MLGKRLPSLDHGTLFVVLHDCPAGAFLDVGHDHVGMGLAGTPHIEAAGNATCNQSPARLEFWVPRVLDEDDAIEVDSVMLAALAAD